MPQQKRTKQTNKKATTVVSLLSKAWQLTLILLAH